MVISGQEEGWEFVNEDVFDLVDEKDRFPLSESETSTVAAASDSDIDNKIEDDSHQTMALQAPSSSQSKRLRKDDEYYLCSDGKPEVSLEDIIREYGLCFLPATSLIRFRAVSKTWDQRITHPFLAHQQTNCFRDLSGFFCQSSQTRDPSFLSLDQTAYAVPSPSLAFLPEKVLIRSSCNGLLCCQSEDAEYGIGYYICNPVTRQWLRLPSPRLYHGLANAAVVLAFDPLVLNFTPVYHVICAVQMPDFPMIRFEVYSSRTGVWEVCENVLCCEAAALDVKAAPGGFYMNGVAYWETLSGKVLAFDVHNKDYGVLPLPRNFSYPQDSGALVEMHGELCYVQPRYADGGRCVVDVYGLHDLKLRQSVCLAPQTAMRGTRGRYRALPSLNTDVLAVRAERMVICHCVRDGKTVVLNNLEEDSWGDLNYWPYVNSLVEV